jgi:hypothetical protein
MSPPIQPGASETDDRFPSGPWFGYYHQWGTQARQRLRLEFAAGTITGEARDPGGACSIRGSYDVQSGVVSLVKTYEAHRVEYAGLADGDGIGGDWAIRYEAGLTDRGIFRIWPDELAMSEAEGLKAEEPVPAAT